MSKTCIITGDTRGIGKVLKEHFLSLGWQVTAFNKDSSIEKIIQQSVNCDLFINNAYADGIQLELFNNLYRSVKKMIVCGSIAARYPDTDMPKYSVDKKILEDRVLDVAHNRAVGQADILLLQLTGKAYADNNTIIKLVDFWLANPSIINVGFEI